MTPTVTLDLDTRAIIDLDEPMEPFRLTWDASFIVYVVATPTTPYRPQLGEDPPRTQVLVLNINRDCGVEIKAVPR